jgi:polyisoprenyl-teichoic acid--peptidoglycan teichoic acid transferase
MLVGLLLVYFLAPLRTNILLLGTDDSPERGAIGRTDTIILTTVVPTLPYVGMLSIPRDLWVTVPGVGEQRINTAYFFAEANQVGAGPSAAMQTIRQNFGVPVHYYAVIHMLGLVSAIDALGGLDIQLTSPTGGYSAGMYHFDGDGALAFVRERSSSDDFSRMKRTQLLITALAAKTLRPANWASLPAFIFAVLKTVETNIPLWQLPRLIFAILRAPLFGLDARTITVRMVVPFQTAGGAQVLAPNWDAINPIIAEMFGR